MAAFARLVLAALAVAGAAVMSCCSSPSQASGPPPLEGTSWILADLPGRTLVGDQRPTASFERGRVHGTDGCNRYSATAVVEDSVLIVGSRGPTTLMACPPDVMAQADAFMAALADAVQYRVVDGRLELLRADRTVLATLAAQSQSLAGTSWHVTGINNGREAVVGLVLESTVTMDFAADGKVSGSGGCNRYTASYQQDGASLRFSPAASTRRMCEGEGLMEQEQAFFAAMQTVSTVRIEGDRLEMRTPDGAMALLMQRSWR